jgi:hypothetical protein
MVFNGDANNQDLVSLADAKAGSNVLSFPLKKKALYANLKAREALRTIWQAYAGWINDGGYGVAAPTEPEVTLNLSVTARYIYPLPNAQYVDAVEAKDTAGNWYPLNKITLEEIIATGQAETAYLNSAASTMQFYRLVENGIRTYPDSNVATASALKAKQRVDITPFTAASTTATPPWDSNLHDGLAIGMALEHAKDNTLAIKDTLASDWTIFLSELANHTRIKFAQNSPGKFKKRRNQAGAYL